MSYYQPLCSSNTFEVRTALGEIVPEFQKSGQITRNSDLAKHRSPCVQSRLDGYSWSDDFKNQLSVAEVLRTQYPPDTI